MLAREAWAKAADCAACAEEADDEHTRILFLKLRDSWIRVANNCEFAEVPESAVRALSDASD